MSGAYPHFKPSYTHEELLEHFLLTPADLQLILACRGETNRWVLSQISLSRRARVESPSLWARIARGGA